MITLSHPPSVGVTATGRLRHRLLADAVVTGANALGYLTFAAWLDDLLGPAATQLRFVGLGLLLFTGVLVAGIRFPGRLVVAIVVLNLLWVVGSLVVAATSALDLTTAGTVWAVAQALVVGLLAGLQAQAQRAAGGAS